MPPRARLLIAFLALLALALPASASAGTQARGEDPVVVIVGDVTVPAGKTVDGRKVSEAVKAKLG